MSFFDHATMGEAFSGPGMDTRQWISYGIVQKDTPDQHSTRFNDDTGNPLPHGVLVDVKLEPSGIIVPCRVVMHNAGSGEGEYSPIGPGDEVLIAVPQGDERAGCAILGKLSNSLDVLPQQVGGMDVTKNNIAYKRLVNPYVIEVGASYSVQQALTHASLNVDSTGAWIIASGDGHHLAINSAVIALETSDSVAGLQINPENHHVLIQADSTTFLFDAAVSAFTTGGTLSISTAGLNATGHAITAEQVGVLLEQLMVMLGAQLTLLPSATPTATTSALGAIITTLATTTGLTALAVTAASTLVPTSPLVTAMKGALAIPADPLGLKPGFGKPGLLF